MFVLPGAGCLLRFQFILQGGERVQNAHNFLLHRRGWEGNKNLFDVSFI